MATILSLSNVSKSFAGRPAIEGVDLSIPADAYVSLLGASGSGKTTLLRLIAGFDEPETGTITFEGTRLDGRPAHERGIGFVFQNFALFPHLNVRDNVAFGLTHRTVNPVRDEAKRAAMVAEAIEMVGLKGLEQRSVTQISGGQRQRVALARTLVTRPKLVLLDEPLGALDAHLRARMRDELRQIRRDLGVTFLHVTGSETEALAMGDRLVVLDAGRVGQFAAPADVYAEPASPGVARYLNAFNLLPGRLDGTAFRTEAGLLAMDTASLRSGHEAPVYAIRHDCIAVRAPATEMADDEAGLSARFLASEYSGASVLSFFALDDGRIVEVEEHLSRGEPQRLEADARYALSWKRRDALVFA
ncbi:ABC transporter ATP-binding protein [Aureimonas pseudogalii]|uniref:Putative spermidine/putrescine transport system ATP-binding protein n=1 Tax=Aureimonas pseudogalii TaxID=1744844 RepID=A0A7W6H626_9HYPH|nr:ABC transporter ATP-binding protein [Aureimonas pseudogalii]MBB3999236.1 putative spermidine/putrescine transport system ATP-binding protein [Aureimonas pseudogalii]